ncbi:MAG: ATP synthase subunit C [Endozoicomonadaceae bacterium]|nr:ATP synthase subunit C [Endozoicomonadaceae bacterium]MCY4330615.1 ATP synthase subunit C [Endozoicomonadaceae bacterium]
MNEFIIMMGWVGVFSPMALGCAGSGYGVSLTGQAACGAMLDVESGYGKYIGLSALPSTQGILGIVIMFVFMKHMGKTGMTVDIAPAFFGIGLFAGIGLMLTSLCQGRAVAAAINAAKNKPEIYGLSIAPAAIVEGFSVFVFVFALVLAELIPKLG